MPIGSQLSIPWIISVILLLFTASAQSGSLPDGDRRISSFEGGQGVYINIAIERVEIDTYEVERGDPVTFKVILHNMGEEGERFVTVRAISGKKVLADRILRLNSWDVRDRMVVTLTWDTAGEDPGRYPVKIEIPMFGDANQFDNFFRLPGEVVIR